ncbi:hypothetical protein BDZ91DRAFT_710358 [Kalaharituber pfeilii]|nr:hypothetical protein BDZ91DRAFT_710358 [Kalaharituber pfeilii]
MARVCMGCIPWGGVLSRQPTTVWITAGRVLARRALASDAAKDSEEDFQEARRWLSQFTPDSIPREFCDISCSRSSGPGGQNVNKLNTKATLRFDLQKARRYIPDLIMAKIQADPQARRYMTKQNELLIQSDTYRKQGDNIDDCFRRLHRAIVDVAALPGETSAEQKERVAKLQREEDQCRMRMKKMHSSKKDARRSKGDGY